MVEAQLSVQGSIIYSPPQIGFWTIPSEEANIDLSEKLLPPMTHTKALNFISPEGFHALSMPEYFSLLFRPLYDSRSDTEAENVRKFIESAMTRYSATLTKIIYSPTNKDTIMHYKWQKSEQTIQADIAGEDGKISKALSLEASFALTGKSPEEAKEILHYLTKKQSYIFRITKKPRAQTESVAGFVAYSDRAGLSCGRFPDGRGDGLGVRVHKK